MKRVSIRRKERELSDMAKITFGELLKLFQKRNPNVVSAYDESGKLKTPTPTPSSDPSTKRWEVLMIPRRPTQKQSKTQGQAIDNKDEIDLDGWNLHRAAQENKLDIAGALIARGDDVYAQNNTDETPLSFAAKENSLEVAKLLIEHGVDLDAKDEDGQTPLHHVAFENSVDVAGLLIDSGS